MRKHDVTLSMVEIHNVSLCGHRRTKPRLQVTCTSNLEKFGYVVPKIRLRAGRQTGTVITILCSHIGGGVIRRTVPAHRKCPQHPILGTQCIMTLLIFGYTNTNTYLLIYILLETDVHVRNNSTDAPMTSEQFTNTYQT